MKNLSNVGILCIYTEAEIYFFIASDFYERKVSIYCAILSSVKGHCGNECSDVTQMKCFVLTHNKTLF